jgi:uncharacterized damage-inducible protein DinB
MSIAQSLLPEFDQEMANTRKTLERLPDDRLDWKAHPKSFSIGAVATHLSQLPMWAKMTVALDELDIQPPGAPPYKMELLTSRAAILEHFDRNLAEARPLLEGASDAHLLANWSLLMTGKVMFAMPRIAVLRSMVVNHMIHHRAQLGVYLRLNDIPVPALYGPSADEGAMSAGA